MLVCYIFVFDFFLKLEIEWVYLTIFFFKICIVRKMKEKIKEKKLKLSHAGFEAQMKNPNSGGAELEPRPHLEKSDFNPGPILRFTHPVWFQATPKPGPDPGFAKPKKLMLGGGICNFDASTSEIMESSTWIPPTILAWSPFSSNSQ